MLGTLKSAAEARQRRERQHGTVRVLAPNPERLDYVQGLAWDGDLFYARNGEEQLVVFDLEGDPIALPAARTADGERLSADILVLATGLEAPALIGRMVVIPYFPLSDEVMGEIVRLQLGRVARTVKENQGAAFTYDDTLVEHVVSRCNDPGSGGRMIDKIITNSILPTISREFLARALRDEPIERVRVSAEEGTLVYAFNDEPFRQAGGAPPPTAPAPAGAAAGEGTPAETASAIEA